MLCPPKLAPLRISAPFEPSDDGPFATWRIVEEFMARPSAVTQGASKVKSCIDVPTTRETVAVEIRPAIRPRLKIRAEKALFRLFLSTIP